MQAQTYTPATYTAGTVQPAVLTTPPLSAAPQPLPTSQNYVRPAKQKQGFMAQIKGTWDKLTDKAQRSWNESTDERFRRYFGFPFNELLFGEFWGEVWTGNQLVSCSVYLSSNWLCMLAKVKDPVTHNKIPLRAQIALRDIIRIQRAITLPSMRGSAPIIQAITDPSVRADSLQVFTRDGLLHQFAYFYNYEKFLATLEHLWHQVTYAQQPAVQPSISTATPNTVPLAQYHQPPMQASQPMMQKQFPATEAHIQQPMMQAGGLPYQQQTTPPYQPQTTQPYQPQTTQPYQQQTTQPYQPQTTQLYQQNQQYRQ